MTDSQTSDNDIKNAETDRLVSKLFDDFYTHLNKDSLTEILLKGHLFIEHYLDHIMLLVFDKNAKIDRKSFSAKVTELRDKNCLGEHEVAISCLYALNRVRNELAHNLDFEVTIYHIDSIGYNLGREFILLRYSKDIDNKKLLIWVLRKIVTKVYYPIYQATMEEYQKKIVVPQSGTVPPNTEEKVG